MAVVMVEEIVQVAFAESTEKGVTLSTDSERAIFTLVGRSSGADHAALQLRGIFELSGGDLAEGNFDA
jgi:hypothetical protein